MRDCLDQAHKDLERGYNSCGNECPKEQKKCQKQYDKIYKLDAAICGTEYSSCALKCLLPW